MSCKNLGQREEYTLLVESIKESIIGVQMGINKYHDMHLISIKREHKDAIKSIILDKESHKKVLSEIYTLTTGDKINLHLKASPTKSTNFTSYIMSSIEDEFDTTKKLKNLRLKIPDPNIKRAVNTILIDQNNVINKLFYINL